MLWTSITKTTKRNTAWGAVRTATRWGTTARWAWTMRTATARAWTTKGSTGAWCCELRLLKLQGEILLEAL